MVDEAEAEHNGVHGVLGNIATKVPNSAKKRSHEQTSISIKDVGIPAIGSVVAGHLGKNVHGTGKAEE